MVSAKGGGGGGGENRNKNRHLEQLPLKPSDIINHLSGVYKLSLREGDILKPTTETLKKIYEALLADKLAFYRPDNEGGGGSVAVDAARGANLEGELELFDDAGHTALLHLHLEKLIDAAWVVDWSLRDLYSPEPSRASKHIAAVVNYDMYRLGKQGSVFNPLRMEVERDIELLREIQEDTAKLRGELQHLAALRESEAQQAAAIAEECQDLGLCAGEMLREHHALAAERELKRGALAEVDDELEAVKHTGLKCKEELLQLKSQVVQSPEKLRNALDQLHSMLEGAKARWQALQIALQALKQKKEGANKCLRKLAKMKDLMLHAEKELEALKAAKQRVARLMEHKAEIAKKASAAELERQADRQAAKELERRWVEQYNSNVARLQHLQAAAAAADEALAAVKRARPEYEQLAFVKKNELHALQEAKQTRADACAEIAADFNGLCDTLMALAEEYSRRIHLELEPPPGLPPSVVSNEALQEWMDMAARCVGSKWLEGRQQAG